MELYLYSRLRLYNCTSQRREAVSIKKTEIIGIYFEIHIRNGNIKCGIS